MATKKGQTDATGEERGVVELRGPSIKTVPFTLVGTSELICHAWSEKAKKQMLDKQMGRATDAKEPKNPEAEYEASFYKLPGGRYGFPSTAFKAAAVRASTYVDEKMTYTRGLFHVVGEFVTIDGEPRMREDMVKLPNGSADIRYRAGFPTWKATLMVEYISPPLTLERLLQFFQIAGFSVGVGEWRPERDGQYGRFRVEHDMEVRG